ncbi:hypothetical protein [Kytococcus sedentarius]|uniref:hypothetical protein n=1 Tax=Kytococcus sedentarius TaxID=1276 RepID=UPI0035BC80AF
MTTPEARAKRATYLAGTALVALVASPVVQNWRPRAERTDDFPLSYYPMFSAKRGATGTVHHLVGIDAEGTEHVLHFRHAGSGGLNQIRRQITRRVKQGQADAVARTVADSVALSGGRTERLVQRVQVVTSRHRYDTFFGGDRTPRERTVRAEAVVPRDPDESVAQVVAAVEPAAEHESTTKPAV